MQTSTQYLWNAMPSRFLKQPQFLLTVGGIACFSLLAWAYAIEYWYEVEPCPLCILQRIIYGAMGIVYLIGAYHNPKTFVRYFYSAGTLLLGIMGILTSSRQIWLQHLPIAEVPSCTAGLDRLLEVYPLLEALKMVLTSAGECSVVNFTILGLSLAEASWITYFLLIALSFSIIVFHYKNKLPQKT